MRHGRAKAARKTLQFFHRTHGFKPPYHILVDGTLVVAALKFKIPLQERLEGLLQREACVLYCSDATQRELQRLQAQLRDANKGGKTSVAAEARAELLGDAEQWLRQHTTILPSDGDDNDKEEGEAISIVGGGTGAATSTLSPANGPSSRGGAEIAELLSGVNSAASRDLFRKLVAASSSSSQKHPPPQSRRYLLASQDEELLDAVRRWGRSPVIRLAAPPGTALLLERPSRAAQHLATESERRKWASGGGSCTSASAAGLDDEGGARGDLAPLQEEPRRPHEQGPSRIRRKAKAKGPNPLSCRKKTQMDGGQTVAKSLLRPTKRRRRDI